MEIKHNTNGQKDVKPQMFMEDLPCQDLRHLWYVDNLYDPFWSCGTCSRGEGWIDINDLYFINTDDVLILIAPVTAIKWSIFKSAHCKCKT